MKPSLHKTIDIGQVAVPVFTCLLGAVLIVVLAAPAPSSKPVPTDPTIILRARLAQARAALTVTTAAQKQVEARLELAEINDDRAGLDKEIAELLRAQAPLTNTVSQTDLLQTRLDEARRKAETSESESRAMRIRISELEQKLGNAKTNQFAALLGNYHGSAVILDCDATGASVTPGGRRLRYTDAAQELQPVFDEIERAGFVVVVARPGSFEKVFDRFKGLVFEHVDKVNARRDTPIGRSSFPLQTEIQLAAMLPKGGAQ